MDRSEWVQSVKTSIRPVNILTKGINCRRGSKQSNGQDDLSEGCQSFFQMTLCSLHMQSGHGSRGGYHTWAQQHTGPLTKAAQAVTTAKSILSKRKPI